MSWGHATSTDLLNWKPLAFPREKATGCTVFAKEGRATVEELKVWDLSK